MLAILARLGNVLERTANGIALLFTVLGVAVLFFRTEGCGGVLFVFCADEAAQEVRPFIVGLFLLSGGLLFGIVRLIRYILVGSAK